MRELFFERDDQAAELAELLANGPLAFDTETIGWRPKSGNRPSDPLVGPTAPRAVCATLAGAEFTCWVRTWQRPGLQAAVRAALAKPGRAVIGHNLGFDAHAARSLDATIGGVWYDTATMSVTECTYRFSHGLKEVTKELLGRAEVVSFAEMQRRVFGVQHGRPNKQGVSKPLASNKPVEGDLSSEHCLAHPEFRAYAMADARNTFDVWVELRRRLRERDKWAVYMRTKQPQGRMAWEAEQAGVYIDRERLEESGRLARAERDRLLGILNAAVPGVNWNSPAQVTEAIGKIIGEPWYESTDVRALTALRDERLDPLGEAYEVIDAKLKYAAVSKQCSAFFDCLPTRLVGNYLHPSIKVHGTDTGRDSCSNPNLYQISGRKDKFGLRKAFAAAPGRRLVVVDYSAIEWVLAMHYSQDAEMLRVHEQGWCAHAYTAYKVFPDIARFVDGLVSGGMPMPQALKEVKKRHHARREAAKTTNYSELYGIWVDSLRARLLLEGVRMPRDEVEKMLRGWQRTYGGFMRWSDRLIRNIGYALEDDTNPTKGVVTLAGRVRHVDPRAWYSARLRGSEERSLKNAIIQGSATDLLDEASARCRADTELQGWGYRLLLRVYDELYGDAPEETAERCCARVKEHMRAAGQRFDVYPQVEVSGGTGACWAEAK